MSSVQATGVISADFEPHVGGVGRWRRVGLLVRDNPLGVFGVAVIFMLIIFATFAPAIAPHDPDAFVADGRLTPSPSHFFGTDKLGHDMFSRVVYGARVSLMIGFSAVIFGTIVGALFGIFSGYV